MNKRQVGASKEELAAEYLRKQGVRIIEKNFRARQGEIDLIAYHNEYLVFIEVKYRTSNQFGTPEEAVAWVKQRTICKVADYYRYRHQIHEFTPIRYDVVSIENEEIRWHQNAFEHRGK